MRVVDLSMFVRLFMAFIIFHRTTSTTAAVRTPVEGPVVKPLLTGSAGRITGAHVITHDNNATPCIVANQDEPLTGQHLVAVVKTIVSHSVVKLSTLRQSLHKVDHSDIMRALQEADIIEIDCKVCCTIVIMILIL